MGWFKSQKEKDAEKIEKLLNGFNITHKYISNDGKMAMVFDDVNQILGYINIDWDSGKLETMRYNEIDAIDFVINDQTVTGMLDIVYMNKKDTEDFVKYVKEGNAKAIISTQLFSNIIIKVETELRRKDFFLYLFSCGMHKPPISKENLLVKSSIEKYLELADLLGNACLKTNEDK